MPTNLNPTRAFLQETFGLDMTLVHGDGCNLRDTDGKEYVDFLSQYGALPFGHNPPEMWAALTEAQASNMPAMVQPLRATEAERLAQNLADITPGDLSVVTLANSGAEAVEVAIKLARARTGRDVILSTLNSFHGKTLGALSATGKDMYQKDFGGPAPGFEYIPFGDLEALEARLAAGCDQIAAFFVEPIQGEGGVICPPDGYLAAVIALCRSYGVLTVVDEIQTGLGRTGSLFACSDGDDVPDMLLLGKALGGGLMPISACVVRPEVWDDRFGFLHSSTFANNNIVCAVANAAIQRLLTDEKRLIHDVATNGAYFRQRLEALHRRYPDVVRDVRGQGYMVGLEFHKRMQLGDSATMAFCGLNGGFIAILSSYLLNVQGILTAPVFNDANVMRLQPPLIASRAELDNCVVALEAMCDLLDRGNYSALVRHMVSPERRTQSQIPASTSLQQGPARNVPKLTQGRFCFLIHYTEEDDLLRSDPSFSTFTDEERREWLQRVKRFGPGFAWPVPPSTSRTGAQVEGMIMSVPLLPKDMIGKGRSVARSMIQNAADMAIEFGAQRLGLGAFTSIVTSGGATVAGRGIPVTSGNTLTTVSAVTAIERVARRVGLDPADAHVVVIGASGAIGRLASLMLARRVGRLTLVGNARNAHASKFLRKVEDDVVNVLQQEVETLGSGCLQKTVKRILPQEDGDWDKSPAERFAEACNQDMLELALDSTTDLDRALEDADIVLVATNADIALVDATRLRPGTIVCDVARPPNVAATDLKGTGVLVFDGGLVQPPFPVHLGPFQNLPENLCWGCLAETMLLALEGESADYSVGRDLELAGADRIAAMARRHGFEPAEPQWYGRMLDTVDFDRATAGLMHRSKSAYISSR